MILGHYFLSLIVLSCIVYSYLYFLTKIYTTLNVYLLDIIAIIFLLITCIFFYYVYLNIISDFNNLIIKKSSNIFENFLKILILKKKNVKIFEVKTLKKRKKT